MKTIQILGHRVTYLMLWSSWKLALTKIVDDEPGYPNVRYLAIGPLQATWFCD